MGKSYLIINKKSAERSCHTNISLHPVIKKKKKNLLIKKLTKLINKALRIE